MLKKSAGQCSAHLKSKLFVSRLSFICVVLLLSFQANAVWAQICATAGQDGPTNVGSSINTYYPAAANTTLTAGSKSITLNAVPATDAYGNNFGTVQISAGDLLMIIQMQDGTISFLNSTLYGANNSNYGPDGLGATGYTSIGSAGKFEYLVATSSVPLTGGTLTFKGAGTGNGVVNTYTNADPTSSSGKRLFQIIRIPQYSNLRLTSNISPPPFNGLAGGVIAFDVAGTMDFNGFTIDVSARGFRGGYSLVKPSVANISNLYVTTADDARASGKGEGIAGTPRYMWDGFNQVDNVIEGLPGGSDGRGAPANAGGGGNDSNSGGGGGGNGGFGGNGGWGYEPIGGINPAGGRPGATVFTAAQPLDNTRLIMGGGGGGGHANDALTGVKGGVGGGIVLISAATIIGNGTILANGGNGAPGVYGAHPDGSGGGGAGGTVFLKVSNPNASASVTIHAVGGLGGNTVGDGPSSGIQPHGPGGGGGGGIVFYANAAGTTNLDVSAGNSGKSDSGNGITHNAENGHLGITQSFLAASLPAYLQGQGSVCYPALVTTMTEANPTATKAAGSTAIYTVKITNSSSSGNAGGVRADIQLASGFSFQSATVVYSGSAAGPATLTNSGTANRPLIGDFNISPGDAVTITMTVNIDCAVPSGTYNGSAEAIYLDPTRTYVDATHRITALVNAFAGTNTSYQSNPTVTVPGSNYDGTASANENVIVLNGSVAITGNTIAQPVPDGVLCTPNADPSLITGSTPAGGTGSFTYQWQSSTDNITFTNIASATAKDYDPPVINATTYYRRVVNSGSCTVPANSNVITIQAIPSIGNNAITAPATVIFCASGDPAVIIGSTPTGGSGAFNYQWQSSADNVGFADITGATGKDYDPPLLNVTTYFRRVITSVACVTPPLSNVVTITIQPALANNTLTAPLVSSFCISGDPAIIIGSTPTGGNGTFTYQWQNSIDGVTFTDITNAIAKDYDPPVISTNTYYRRVAVSGVCTIPAVSNVIMLQVTPAVANNIITAPALLSFCASGDPAVITGSTPTGGTGAFAYQWQSSADNVSFADIAGATGKDYDPPVLTATTYFRRVITSGFCTAPPVSNVILITVQPVLANNLITAPGVSTFCGPGDPAAIAGSTPTGGSGIYAYQWQSSVDNVTFTDIATATAQTYDPPLLNATTYYRRMITSGFCSAPLASNVVTIKIGTVPATPVPVATTLNICYNTTTTMAVSSPVTGVTYNWYNSPAKTAILYSGTSYTTGSLTAGITYYVEAVSGTCSSSAMGSVQVNVSPFIAVPVLVSNSFTVCSGSPVTLNISNPQTGITYNWYTTATSGTSVGTGTSYLIAAATVSGTYYAEAANAGGCTAVSRTPATVTVQPIPAAPQVDPVGVCPGNTATLTAITADPNVTINWYTTAIGGTSIATGKTYTTGILNADAIYYAEAVTNVYGCASTSRTSAKVSILQQLPAPVVTVGEVTGTSITFQWQAVPGATGYLVSLDNGSTFITPSSGSGGLLHKITGLQMGQSVSIIARATGASCQLSSNSVTVTTIARNPLGSPIYVPNVFTPNNDGSNDILYVYGIDIKSVNFYIYSQWGELLFKSNNQASGWDGTYKGTQEPVGVYVYYLDALTNDGQKVNMKGTVTLVR